MEKRFQKKSKINRNIFNKIDFIKGNKINYRYRDVVQRLKKFSARFNHFIDYIENSLENDLLRTGRFSHKPNNKKKSKLLISNVDKYNTNNSLRIFSKTKNSFNFPQKQKIIKNIYKPKMIEFNKKKKINYYQKSLNKKIPSNLNNSMILSNTERKTPNNLKTKNLSVSCSKIFEGNNSSKYKLNNYYYFKNKNIKNSRKIRPETVTNTKSIEEYNNKLSKSRKNKSLNNSKNLSLSLYKNKQNFFENYKNKLKPEYLTNFVKKSNKIKKSYENDFEVNMTKQTKDLLKIAEDEINMKDPDYHLRQIFKNVLHVKKTVKFIKKMRAEKKTRVQYFGPGNINNESYIRTKHANLVRFCDSICHMKDDKFYEYRQLLNDDIYPNLSKQVFKEKYQIEEKDMVYEKKCSENQHKINRLFALMQK